MSRESNSVSYNSECNDFVSPLFQFEDSEDDFDRFDTDDELSYRRDSVYSCVTLPYFHSFLFIKGKRRHHTFPHVDVCEKHPFIYLTCSELI